MREHQRILVAEKSPERNLFYQLLWEIGSSQSDAAALTAENIDWPTRTLTYFRKKIGEQAQLAIGKPMATILEHLPTSGPLFPKISATIDNARSAEFYRRCKLLGIEGVSLHSYRYAWAERAKNMRIPGKICAGGAWTQQQGRASRLREESPRPDTGAGRIRKENGDRR